MKTTTRTLGGALVLAATLLAGQTAAVAAPPRALAAETQGAASARVAADRALVVGFAERLYNRHDLSAIKALLTPDFIQHDPRIADGRAGLRDYLTAQNAVYPNSHVSIKRVIAQGDLVAVHSNLVLEPGTRGFAVLDLYRLSGGKIAEHWNGTQEVPATTLSGNDMFSTLSSPRVSQPDPHAPTALNKRIVTAMYTQLFVDKDVTAFDRYVVDPYYQHNPGIANGIQGGKDGIGGLFAAFPDFTTGIFRIVAEGDLVIVQSQGTLMPGVASAVFDLFRVQNGKIVEHWDVVESVPATSANDNTMF